MRVPEPERTIRRDLSLERRLTREAARGVVDASELIDFAEARAQMLASAYVSDPLTIKLGLSRPCEIREELEDARNHAVFLAQERELSEDEARDVQIAQRHIAIAYDVIGRLL